MRPAESRLPPGRVGIAVKLSSPEAIALGKEILRWSDGRAFLEVIGQEKLLKESRSYSADIVLKSRDGKRLPAGWYTLIGFLTTQGSGSGLPGMTGTVIFEIRDIH